jgi:hypothetical protein
MRLPNVIALSTVADLLDASRSRLSFEAVNELECLPEAWTVRKAWSSLSRDTRAAIRASQVVAG